MLAAHDARNGGPVTNAATRQDLHVIREWLRRAERDAEPGAGRIMSEYERECLRRIIDGLVVRDVEQ